MTNAEDERSTADIAPAPPPPVGKQARHWWSHTVGYQIYVRSFADANGDGVGDLAGITAHLGYLELLGIQTVWITPFYPSPMADAGYDVSNPRDVDPAFGTLDDFDALIRRAHQHGLKVLIDLVPNHTSSAHPWFQAALAAGPGSRERDRYLFRDGRGPAGADPPNNWASIFGGPAWTRVVDGQWYLHLFDSAQPDLNWRHPDVHEDLRETLEFWLVRGVDGFRIDVAHGMAKPPELPDAPAGGAAFDRQAFDRAASEAAREGESVELRESGRAGRWCRTRQRGQRPAVRRRRCTRRASLHPVRARRVSGPGDRRRSVGR